VRALCATFVINEHLFEFCFVYFVGVSGCWRGEIGSSRTVSNILLAWADVVQFQGYGVLDRLGSLHRIHWSGAAYFEQGP
jgi:hypothetical protein